MANKKFSIESLAGDAAMVCAKVGYSAAKYVALFGVKKVGSGVSAVVSAVKGPQPQIVVSDTKNSAKTVLLALISWGITHNYWTREVYRHAKAYNSTLVIGYFIQTKLLQRFPHRQFIIQLGKDGAVNDFWQQVLQQHRIPYTFH